MNIPFWKKYLSYLFELHIESAPSKINPHLYVSLNKGRYQLSTANAIYSFADLYDNFSFAFQKIHLPHNNSKVLLLGLGLGSIPYMLERNFNKNYQYTAIEIDENILYLASKYTLPYLTSSINMQCADALHFVNYCQESFDLICMDVFLDDVVPIQFEKMDFLAQLKSLLNPDGIILFNRLANTEADKIAANKFMNIFMKIFPDGMYLEPTGNWIFMNDKTFLK